MKMVKPSEITDPIHQETKVDVNFWEITGLPSQMKLYPKGTVIKGRPLKTVEVKKLATMSSSNMDTIINDVISTSIIGIDVNDILIADKLYVLFWLRANTYKESGFNVPFTCKSCKKPSTYEFNIDNVKTIDIRTDYEAGKQLELPSSKDTITIKQLSIADSILVSNFLKTHEKSLNQFDEDMLSKASQIDSINGKSAPSLLKLYEYVENLNPSDYAYVTSYLNHTNFGINNELSVKCLDCGGTTSTGVTFQPKFFIPTYKF